VGLIELRTFGPGEVVADGEYDPAPLLAQPKRFALLCYLALPRPGSMHRRDTLLGIFWPEVDQQHSRMALRQALSHIRRNLGQDILVRRGTEDVGLNPDYISCDATAYEDALAQERWEDAIDIYRGEFLEGLVLPNVQEFKHWLDTERTRFAGKYAFALEELANAATAEGHTRSAAKWWQLLIHHDPFNSRYGIQLMKALERDNDPANALLFARQHAELLREEFGIAPPREFEVFVEEMRRAHSRSPTSEQTVPATGGPTAAESSAPFPELASARNWPKNVVAGRGHIVALGAAAVLLLVVGATVGKLIFDRGTSLTPHRVVVLPFEIHTSDTDLRGLGFLTADWIGQALQQVAVAEVVPVAFARQYAEETSGSGANALAHSVAHRSGSGLVVCGSIYSLGDSLRYHVEVIDAVSSLTLQNFDATWPKTERVGAVTRLGQRVAGALAAQLDPGLASISRMIPTPPTLAAWREYSLGRQFYQREEYQAAVEHLLTSFTLDTNFVRAVVAAGHAARDYVVKDSLAQFAEQRRDRLSQAGQLELDVLHALVKADFESALRSTRQLAQMHSGGFSHVAHAMFALRLNRPREALRALERYDPNMDWRSDEADAYWLTKTEALHMIGDHERELAEAREARRRYPDRLDILNAEVLALSALGRHDELDDVLAEATSMPGQSRMAHWEPMVNARAELLEHGFPEATIRSALFYAVELAELQTAEQLEEPNRLIALARVFYGAGMWSEAELLLEESKGIFNDNDARLAVHYLGILGSIAARQGNERLAVEICDSLDGFEHPYMHGSDLFHKARVMAILGRAEESFDLLKEAISQGVGFGAWLLSEPDLTTLYQREDFRGFMDPKA